MKAAIVETFSPMEIFERDGWRCGICSELLDPSAFFPHPQSPSIDHIVPLSKGGEHSRANVRAAHLRCNVRRGNRAPSSEALRS
jgi:5-methylcytosine-specific restriction endonuclease McrA